VTTGGEIWFVPPAGEPKRISPEFAANCFFVGEQLYAYTDSRCFEVDVAGGRFALTSQVFD